MNDGGNTSTSATALTRPLEITFTGDVYTVYLEINSHEVDLHGDGGGTYKRTFADYPPGQIKVLLHVKGINTTAWNLTMKYAGQALLAENGVIRGGFSHLDETVVLS